MFTNNGGLFENTDHYPMPNLAGKKMIRGDYAITGPMSI